MEKQEPFAPSGLGASDQLLAAAGFRLDDPGAEIRGDLRGGIGGGRICDHDVQIDPATVGRGEGGNGVW
jgi:hypothetical protein